MIVPIQKLWPWWLLFSSCLATWTDYIEEHDSMRVVQCNVKCSRYSPIEECMEICLSANYTKAGNCPGENSMSPFEAACLIACNADSQCPDVAKCCSNNCGITCMNPTGLEERQDLPEIPNKIEIRREKSNLVTLHWNTRDLKHKKIVEDWIEYDQSIMYLVEERHVLGPRYLESRLSSWSVRQVTNKNHVSIRVGIKTGHWYQFRVAAVNEIGSRGYSAPSIPFKTAEPRNPREPRNLSLSGARVHTDGKLGILIHWRQPSSDVPVMFYKLFWSRFIHGPTNDSILVYHRSVSKDKSCFEIKNLDIGCQYFFQVQAVAIYGGRRLVSRKASKVFNSTDYMKYADVDKRSDICDKHDAGLRVRRLICQCGETIEARLVWPADPHAVSYNVTWREDSCLHANKNIKSIQNSITIPTMSQLTQNSRLDIKRLKRDCTYSVNVRSIDKEIEANRDYENELKLNNDCLPVERSLGIEFVTYGCKHYRIHDDEHTIGDFDVHRCKRRRARIKRLENAFLL